MIVRVYRIRDRAAARKVLESDEVKRVGYILRDGKSLGVGEGEYVYIKADEAIHRLFEESGAFERPENEEEIRKKIEEEQESANAGVGFLGF